MPLTVAVPMRRIARALREDAPGCLRGCPKFRYWMGRETSRQSAMLGTADGIGFSWGACRGVERGQCSISASTSAPSRTAMAEIQSQVMKPITAPSEP